MAAKYPEDYQHGCETVPPQGDTQYLSGCVPGQTVTPECEIQMEGYSLDELNEKCTKNPGHPNFIQVSKFNRDHLPPDIRNRDNIMESIQRRIDQTVRVRVAYTSLDRPDFFSDNCSEYPYRDSKGKRGAIRYGTGSINRMMTPDLIEGKSCPCRVCKTSGNPSKKYCKLTVFTSTHVIFDDSEAEKASFDCFFDSDQSEPIYTLYGLHLDKKFIKNNLKYHSDQCEVICVTHDESTIQKLSSTIFPSGLPRFLALVDPPAEVMVSHPHGRCKQITIGHSQFLTVPIKPVFEKNTPIPLLRGTKCKFHPRKPGLESNESGEYQINNIESHHSINEMDFIKIKEILYKSSNGNESKTKCKEMPLKPDEGNSTNNFDCVKTISKLKRIELKIWSSGIIQDEDMLWAQTQLDLVIDVLELFKVKENSSDTKDGCISKFRKLVLTLGKFVDFFDNWVQDPVHSGGIESLNKEIGLILLDNQEWLTELSSSFIRLFKKTIAYNVDAYLRMIATRTDDESSEEELIMKFNIENYTNEPFMRNSNIEKKSDSMEPNETLMSDPESMAIVDRSFEKIRQVIMDKNPELFELLQLLELEPSSLVSVPWVSRDTKPEEGVNIALPPGLTFTLPEDAKYAMIYYKPGRFQFPPGTQFTKSDGMKVPIPDGTEFVNECIFPHHRHFYVSYDNNTCPGSSGATVYNNFLRVPGLTHFTHSGSVDSKYNRSCMQESLMMPDLSILIPLFIHSDIRIEQIFIELLEEANSARTT